MLEVLKVKVSILQQLIKPQLIGFQPEIWESEVSF